MNGIAQQSTWMTVRGSFTGSLLLLALGLHAARAEPITIINSSFEDLRGKTPGYFGADGRLLNGKYTYAKAATSENGVFSFNPIPGWGVTGEAGTIGNHSGYPTLRKGRLAVHIAVPAVGESVSLEQSLCAELVAGRYTLSLDLHRLVGYTWPGYRLQLLAGGQIVGQDDDTVLPAEGGIAEAKLVVDVSANHPLIGQRLGVRFLTAGPAPSNGAIDDFRLDGPASSCDTYANSESEFTSAQGENGWWYGYYNSSSDLSGAGYDPILDFAELPLAYRPGVHGVWAINDNFWTEIGPRHMHPNSGLNNEGRTVREHWAIRRWVSDVNGFVEISGRLFRKQAAGDGALSMIFLNGRQIFTRKVGVADLSGSYGIVVNIRASDKLDFALSCDGTAGADTTEFTAEIRKAVPNLAILPAAELAIPTVAGVAYQLQGSTDLLNWATNGLPRIQGTGLVEYHLISKRERGAYQFFRANEVR